MNELLIFWNIYYKFVSLQNRNKTNMLTVKKIKTIALQGEGQHADFKRSVPSKVRELANEICALR